MEMRFWTDQKKNTIRIHRKYVSIAVIEWNDDEGNTQELCCCLTTLG